LPEKPRVVSQYAVSLAPREAILSAVVGTDKADTRYHIVYGPSEAYGLSAPAHEMDLGSSPEVQVSLQAVELEPNTTYHYALLATNAGGSIISPDQTFTTAPAFLPAVETLAANEVSQNTATISGSVDCEGVQSTYEFDIGTDTSYGARVFGDAGSVSGAQSYSLALAGLAPATTYHYRVVGISTYGVAYGADRTFTTAGFPTALITSPSAQMLVPTPAFEPPSSAGAITPKATVKTKLKPRKRVNKKSKKATKTSRQRAKGRIGR
jgi:hypothetical protein